MFSWSSGNGNKKPSGAIRALLQLENYSRRDGPPEPQTLSVEADAAPDDGGGEKAGPGEKQSLSSALVRSPTN